MADTTLDDNFPAVCNTDWNDVYCCTSGNGFIDVSDNGAGGPSGTVDVGCMNFPSFPASNSNGQPMLKTALNATTQSPWVRIGFLGVNKDGSPNSQETLTTILTMGNDSQPGNKEKCQAAITAFQYSWGTDGKGTTAKVTIVDQKGAEFVDWVQRLVKNPESASDPITGVNRCIIQFGWYISGGGSSDICGQVSAGIGSDAVDGQNTSHVICSPPMYFVARDVSTQWHQGKFVYEINFFDIVHLAQQQAVAAVMGNDEDRMYFTDAVHQLGKKSMPPFRVAFLSRNQDGEWEDMEFAIRPGQNKDDPKKGPFDIWRAKERQPLAVIHDWILSHSVQAIDKSGFNKANDKSIGITFHYDPTYVADDVTDENLPRVGILNLTAGGSMPVGVDTFTDGGLNNVMKAVYIVNGGNCAHGYSTILTESGWERINKLVKLKYSGRVACVDENGDLTWSKITNWYRNLLNNRKMIKVHLHNSRQRSGSISGAIFTEDHPILTDKGYIQVKDLKISEHLIHSGTYCPSKEVHEAVIGMILGDGHIRRRSFAFSCIHCGAQREYIEHKGNLLGLKAIDKPDKKFRKIKITSKASPYWRNLRKLFYPNGIKIINNKILEDFTIISLAFLYMDDGSINGQSAEIATCGFVPEEVDLLVEKIQSLGISCHRRKNCKWPRILFNKEGARSLMKKIAPYIISSMDYKILPEYRLESKVDFNLEEIPFYDKFDLIRCDKLEQTKYVYCIDVEKYHNFITHSGVVHNCSPVIEFNPKLQWQFEQGIKAVGNIDPNSGQALKQDGVVKANWPIVGGRGQLRKPVPAADMANRVTDPGKQVTAAIVRQQAAFILANSIQAELRVQGDPSDWLCTPATSHSKTVGIIFINPFFLQPGAGDTDCPIWSEVDPNDPNATVCNKVLTSKAWWILGADHQIRDGQFTTTIRVNLVAPGAETTSKNMGADPNAEEMEIDPPCNLGDFCEGDDDDNNADDPIIE